MQPGTALNDVRAGMGPEKKKVRRLWAERPGHPFNKELDKRKEGAREDSAADCG